MTPDKTETPSAVNAGAKGGGVNTTTGLWQSLLSGTASRLVAGKTDSLLVRFTQPAPAAGWTITLSSSNAAAAQVPATYLVPAGVSVVHPPVTGGNVSDATNATVSVRLNTEARNTNVKVFPLRAGFPAPQLQSPGNGADFKPRTIAARSEGSSLIKIGDELYLRKSDAATRKRPGF